MHLPSVLSFLIWIPVVSGIFVLTFSPSATLARAAALFGAVLGALPLVPLVAHFDAASGAMQFVERVEWLPQFGIAYHLGVDGISLWFTVLTAVTTLIVFIASWQSVTKQVAQYYGAFLVLSGCMQGVFASLDGMLFFVFFEASLIPLYLLIGTWGGGERRVYAAIRYFFFSLLGSLAMLAALIYLWSQAHTFDIDAWRHLELGFAPQIAIFVCFLAAFSVKVPMWPVHTWLPDVNAEGPTGAAVLLGMLKIGGYGMLRYVLPIVPDAAHFFAPAMIALSLVAVIYGSLVALAQTDMRKLLAYSAVAHMGLVTLGLFTFDRLGTEGAVVQMLSYGIVSGAMLLCTGVLVERTNNGSIDAYGGVANTMPRFAACAMLFSMANVGLPGTSGFVGEFLVLMGAIRVNFWIGAAAASSLILSAAYTLWMVKRVIFGAVKNDRVAMLRDLGKREFALFGAMAVLVLAIGVHPKTFTDAMGPSVESLLSAAQGSSLPADENAPSYDAHHVTVSGRTPG
ncbi:proton-translocating NADH-quinone oxidoreductase subunit M [Caballeronia catudaia]|uniref:Proton-translocating NADH-quinone oxidoreductase subunit M n=1 Tax=Caballeronia catudaia TaxID=1777136 RepID=A0A158BF14_9BURK|nr:NADH-quinone oxidoreductase subunit M [Caballeronia catudaia]SAK68623.1 proton-translocating NADH-quinone oxidoreductase subunit M [Caballeronia catudaia]